jgi:hypothetical protein
MRLGVDEDLKWYAVELIQHFIIIEGTLIMGGISMVRIELINHTQASEKIIHRPTIMGINAEPKKHDGFLLL